MARPLRLEYEGALYHVTARGNERATIFRDQKDRRRIVEMLGSVADRLGWVVHAYCLMGNHYHLLLETPHSGLARGMQRLNSRYTQWFNHRHRRTGHLLQGRYKAILVEREAHLLELCRYVVLNPVRVGLVDDPGQWMWSNYGATLGRIAAPKWLEVNWTLSQFSPRRKRAGELYRRFVAEGKGLPSPIKGAWGQVYLGGEAFRREMDQRLKGRHLDSDIPSAQRRPWVEDAVRIREVVAAEYGRRPAELSRRRGGEDKQVAIYLTRIMTNLTGASIGKVFGVTASQVSHVVRDLESTKDGRMIHRLKALEKKLRR